MTLDNNNQTRINRAAAWVVYCQDKGRSEEEMDAALNTLTLALMDAEVPVYEPSEHPYYDTRDCCPDCLVPAPCSCNKGNKGMNDV